MDVELAKAYRQDSNSLFAEAIKAMMRRKDKRLLGNDAANTWLAYPDYPFGWATLVTGSVVEEVDRRYIRRYPPILSEAVIRRRNRL